MNSGKSSALIQAAYNYEEQGLPVVTMKPTIDTKGEQYIVSRGGHSRRVDILAPPEMNVREELAVYRAELGHIACVMVDESQFLQPIQVDQLLEVAKLDETSVITYGIRTDYQRHVFPGSLRLFELADNIEKLPTMCGCQSQAENNARKINGEFVFDGEQVAIDGEDNVTYTSLCSTCYLKALSAAQA